MEEILERQLFIRGHAFVTFSTIEKALAGRQKSFLRPTGRMLCSLQACVTLRTKACQTPVNSLYIATLRHNTYMLFSTCQKRF